MKYGYYKNTCVERRLSSITVDSLRKFFHVPICEAAVGLDISESSLKKICRKLKIKRWPYRTVKKMAAKLNVDVMKICEKFDPTKLIDSASREELGTSRSPSPSDSEANKLKFVECKFHNIFMDFDTKNLDPSDSQLADKQFIVLTQNVTPSSSSSSTVLMPQQQERTTPNISPRQHIASQQLDNIVPPITAVPLSRPVPLPSLIQLLGSKNTSNNENSCLPSSSSKLVTTSTWMTSPQACASSTIRLPSIRELCLL